MLVCIFLSAFARETAGAARTRSSLRPLLRVALLPLGVALLPLGVALRPLSSEGKPSWINSDELRRENAEVCLLFEI